MLWYCYYSSSLIQILEMRVIKFVFKRQKLTLILPQWLCRYSLIFQALLNMRHLKSQVSHVRQPAFLVTMLVCRSVWLCSMSFIDAFWPCKGIIVAIVVVSNLVSVVDIFLAANDLYKWQCQSVWMLVSRSGGQSVCLQWVS